MPERVSAMSKNSEHVKDYKHKLKATLLFIFGDECLFCDSKENLEFAHKQPNEFSGMGRGSYKRLIHIKNHITVYFLLCHECHKAFDRIGSTSPDFSQVHGLTYRKDAYDSEITSG